MMSSKRSSYSASTKSSKHNGKLKEILSSSSSTSSAGSSSSHHHHHKGEPKIADIKDFSNVPLIKEIDNPTLIYKYTTVLIRNPEEGVAMDDLDQLQQDLEKLLSTNALRSRFFLGEHSHSHSGHDRRHERLSLKRKRDDVPKYKDMFVSSKNGLRVIKRDPFRSFSEKSFKEIPKITLPRNDNSDKFWASIEPYCSPVSKDDIAFLDSLIQEFSKEIELKIPDVGEHYSSSWSDEIINDEQNLGKITTKRASDCKKSGLHAMMESFGSPHTQRFLAALIHDRGIKVINANPKNGEDVKINKAKSSDFSKMRHNIGQKVGNCLDKRLLKELVEQGILTPEDISKSNNPEDEILTEIKKCQQELITVNEYNLEELNKLRTAIMNDIHCNQLKDDLDKVDKEMLDLYNNIMIAKIKCEGSEKGFPEKLLKDFETKTNALLRQQHVLNREINNMTDMSMLY